MKYVKKKGRGNFMNPYETSERAIIWSTLVIRVYYKVNYFGSYI